ncbi:hypothetical protein IMCC3317_12130 [Kordia antarctica]|uniref:Lipocalin-like domain-containing protein n=1 Tax=Kordia antarctica TaxID=1218801 RepID=A0A7L4ZGV4_9FLAO|nr:hypothetical protein [Kordia antarctica]QHI35865.1 hypothetical protein IMCC3317_12130 [Kordia antarctica]
MMNLIFKRIAASIIVLFLVTNCFGQNNVKKYLAHNHNYSTDYSYSIREIIIHPDSTYIFKNYSVSSKKEWKTYKQYKPEISSGTITKSSDYFVLTEYRSGHETDFSWTVKISDRKIVFFFPNRKGKMRTAIAYKRIYN